MTRDEIIRMAREAGAKPGIENEADAEFLERFAALVVAKEREACARVAAWILKMPQNDVSAAIRARGMTPNVGIEPPKVGSNDGLGPVTGAK